jgi:hypothetical protein
VNIVPDERFWHDSCHDIHGLCVKVLLSIHDQDILIRLAIECLMITQLAHLFTVSSILVDFIDDAIENDRFTLIRPNLNLEWTFCLGRLRRIFVDFYVVREN